ALASGLSAPVTDTRQLAHQNHWGSVSSASPSTHASLDPLCARASPTRAASRRYLWLLVRQATTGPGEMKYTSAWPKHNRRVSLYSCVTNLMLWGYILPVAPETSSMEGGDRFHLDTSHDR